MACASLPQTRLYFIDDNIGFVSFPVRGVRSVGNNQDSSR